MQQFMGFLQAVMWIVLYLEGTERTSHQYFMHLANTIFRQMHIVTYYFEKINYIFFSVALRPNMGHGLLILEVSWSNTTTHHSREDSSGRVTGPSHRPLPDNTQRSTQTNIHVPGGIRTHNPSKRVAADLRLRPRGHWDRLYFTAQFIKFFSWFFYNSDQKWFQKNNL